MIRMFSNNCLNGNTQLSTSTLGFIQLDPKEQH